jgi:hypothetical protein
MLRHSLIPEHHLPLRLTTKQLIARQDFCAFIRCESFKLLILFLDAGTV